MSSVLIAAMSRRLFRLAVPFVVVLTAVSVGCENPWPPEPTPDPTHPTTVPNVVGQTWDKAGPQFTNRNLYTQLSQSLGWVTTPDHILVTSTAPKGGATVASWSTVYVTVTLTDVVSGISQLDIYNQTTDQHQLTLYVSTAGGSYESQGTIAYSGEASVTFQNSAYTVVLVDPNLLNCASGQPNDVSCQRGYVSLSGNSGGPHASWFVQ